jgi:hypothetical protein
MALRSYDLRKFRIDQSRKLKEKIQTALLSRANNQDNDAFL